MIRSSNFVDYILYLYANNSLLLSFFASTKKEKGQSGAQLSTTDRGFAHVKVGYVMFYGTSEGH